MIRDMLGLAARVFICCGVIYPSLVADTAAAGAANEQRGAVRQAVVKKHDTNGDGKLDAEEEAVVVEKIAPEVAVEILGRESKNGWLGSARGKIDKVGVMVDPEYPFYPEAAVRGGYRSVPMLIIAGRKDPFFGGKAPTVPEAKAAGLGNVEWLFDGLRQAIDEQNDAPHKLLVLNTGHVPTVKQDGRPVHDEVDAFIKGVVAARTSHPFEKIKTGELVGR